MSDHPNSQRVAPRRDISTRLRFTVFKRDAFTCQYCGRRPPDVTLECDHIVPVSMGGANDIHNLVTACFDCNRGKGAEPLEIVPQSLEERAAEMAEREAQMRAYAALMQEARDRLESETWEVLALLHPGKNSVPKEHHLSVKRFVEKLGLHDTLEAAETALRARIYGSGRLFKYFCGVCWNKIREREGKL